VGEDSKMPQIIPARRTPFADQMMSNISENLGQGFGNLMQRGEKLKQIEEENKWAEKMGMDLKGIKNPEMRQKIMIEQLKGISEKEKIKQEKFEDENSYSQIKQTFGKKFADIWKAAPTGGRTELLKQGLDAKIRGDDLERMLEGVELPQESKQQNIVESDIEDFEEPSPKKEKQIDFDKGTTPKERITRQDKRYSQNLPLFQESQKKKIAQEMIGDEIEILQDLSSQIGVMERFNINPKTGDILIPALASPEAQRFLKTVNDFTIQAKDSYGSRVTNFDLANFMRRLPTLANSEEGRRQILQQMKIINDVNILRENALHDIIDEYGGIRNIDYDKAQTLAEKKSNKEISELKKQFKDIGSQQERIYNEHVKGIKAKAPKGMVTIETEDGEMGYIPANEVKTAMKKGAKIL
jgi:hypothetical protein